MNRGNKGIVELKCGNVNYHTSHNFVVINGVIYDYQNHELINYDFDFKLIECYKCSGNNIYNISFFFKKDNLMEYVDNISGSFYKLSDEYYLVGIYYGNIRADYLCYQKDNLMLLLNTLDTYKVKTVYKDLSDKLNIEMKIPEL